MLLEMVFDVHLMVNDLHLMYVLILVLVVQDEMHYRNYQIVVFVVDDDGLK